jgi:LPXTG-motif cell wall-anchored protein
LFRTPTRRPAVRAALALAGLTVPAVFALAVLTPSAASAYDPSEVGDVITQDQVDPDSPYTKKGDEVETPAGDATPDEDKADPTKEEPTDEETTSPDDEDTHDWDENEGKDPHDWDEGDEQDTHHDCYDPSTGKSTCDYDHWKKYCDEYGDQYPEYCDEWEKPADNYGKDYDKKDEKSYEKKYDKKESLPVTGASLPAVAIAAAVLLLLGVVTLVFSARRRRRSVY